MDDGLWRTWEDFEPHHATWEPQTKAFVDRLRPGDLFVDVGAWIGPVTLWALDRGAKVIAFEPDPAAAAEFRRRIDTPNAVLIEAAVGPRSGTVHLSEREGTGYGTSMSTIGPDGIEVPMVDLREFLDGPPDAIKIDIEGYETELCPTLVPWLAEHQSAIQISLHETTLDPAIFGGYSSITYPDDPLGDIVALP